jgi:hypothetical protein
LGWEKANDFAFVRGLEDLELIARAREYDAKGVQNL